MAVYNKPLVPARLMTNNSILRQAALSLAGVPALFTLIYASGYGSLFPSDWDLVWLAICTLSGMWITYRMQLNTVSARIAASGAYGIIMTGVLFFLALGVACGNDNCL